MTDQPDTRRALDAAERAALRAGKLVMEGWRAGTEIARKGRFDLLTKYDLESEHLIREALSREFPAHRIVGEEGAETGEGDLVWYVDPIDGTTNYAHGHFFLRCRSRCIGAEKGWSDSCMHRRLGSPGRQRRAWVPFETENRARCRPASNSKKRSVRAAFPTTVGPTATTISRSSRSSYSAPEGIRRCGSAAVDLCPVADGTYDIYWERGSTPGTFVPGR